MASKTFKGFIHIARLADNDPNKTNRFGELTAQARTFSRDKRNYAFPEEYPFPEIVAFSMKDATGQQDSLNPSDVWQKYVLSIGQWLAEQHLAGTIPDEANRDRLWASLTGEFTNAIWTGMGIISHPTNSAKNMPEWISFDLDDGGNMYSTKLWLSDPVFQSGADQYDEYETSVIAPAEPIDLVINEFSIVQPLVRARDNAITILDLVNEVKKNVDDPSVQDPETRIAHVQLKWVDPTDANVTMKHTFTLVHYGIAGADYENQKAAIRDYLETNGLPENLDKWPNIYPELYSETEFAVIPTWDILAVQPQGSDIGLYSSTIPLQKLFDNAKKMTPPGFNSTSDVNVHIMNNAEATSVFFRAMQVATIGNPNNTGQTYRLRQVFPDYTHEPTGSVDFDRMKKTTQDFVLRLNNAIGIARTMNANNRLPDGFTRIIRGNKMYVTFVDSGFMWMVISRMSYMANV